MLYTVFDRGWNPLARHVSKEEGYKILDNLCGGIGSLSLEKNTTTVSHAYTEDGSRIGSIVLDTSDHQTMLESTNRQDCF